MDEKNLVTLPDKAVAYLEYMKRNNYTLIGAFKKASGTDVMKEYMDDYFSFSSNQEKFALAWINGYKVEEKKFLVKFKNIDYVYGYLNYERKTKIFKLSSKDESKYFQTIFTKKFLEENGFGWVFDSEGVQIIEVEND